ncbi:MAG: tetratricopeptide repeat protein [Omnitrophica WOR_2 bacterium]
MKKFWENGILLRLLIPCFLILAFNIAPRPHEEDRSLRLVQRALSVEAYRMASIQLARALQYIPWRSDLWERAGQYALQGGEPQAAIQNFQQAKKVLGLTPEGYLGLGDAYQASGDLTSAVRTWQALQPSVEVYSRLSQAHAALGDYPSQVKDLKGLIALQPKEAKYVYQLGLLQSALQPESAQPYLEQAAQLDGQYAKTADGIVQAIQSARESGEPAYLNLIAGRTLASLEEWKLASVAFRQATQVRPDYAEAWAFLGEALQHLTEAGKDKAAGLAELQKAHQIDPGSLVANTFLALYWQRQGNYEQALSYLRSAAASDRTNPTLQTEMGNILAEMGDLPAALACYQKATELVPDNPVFWRILAEFSLANQIQIREIALPAARQAVLLSPDDPVALDLLGESFLMLEDYTSAGRFIQRALASNPDYVPAHLHLGIFFILQGKLEEGRQELLKVKELDPNGPYTGQAQRVLERTFQ